jgi:hypothetical protein
MIWTSPACMGGTSGPLPKLPICTSGGGFGGGSGGHLCDIWSRSPLERGSIGPETAPAGRHAARGGGRSARHHDGQPKHPRPHHEHFWARLTQTLRVLGQLDAAGRRLRTARWGRQPPETTPPMSGSLVPAAPAPPRPA